MYTCSPRRIVLNHSELALRDDRPEGGTSAHDGTSWAMEILGCHWCTAMGVWAPVKHRVAPHIVFDTSCLSRRRAPSA